MIKELVMYMEEQKYKNPSIEFAYQGEKEYYKFYKDGIYLFGYTLIPPENETIRDKRNRLKKSLESMKEMIIEYRDGYYYDTNLNLKYLQDKGINTIVEIKLNEEDIDYRIKFYNNDNIDATELKLHSTYIKVMGSIENWFYRKHLR